VFRQLSPTPCPPGHSPRVDQNGHVAFYPWARTGEGQTRDSAAPTSIKGRADQQLTLAKVVDACLRVDARLTALEARRSALAQQQEMFQRQMTVRPQPTEQPDHMPTQDSAAPSCACQHQHVLTPQKTKDGVNTMQRNAQLAPLRGVTFDPVSRSTRDAQNIGATYGEQPSRFDSRESDRLASSLPRGSAGCPTQRELNDAYAAHWARDAGAAPLGAQGVNKRGGMVEAVSSDPSEAFLGPGGPFTQFRNDDVRPSPAALGELNRQFARAKTQGQRDAITDAWKSYMSAPRDAASMASQWKPKQPAITPQAPRKDNTDDERDANWSSLYEANKSTIGGDPNKISPGMSLNLPGGGTHTVQSGETLSGIASTPAGSDLGSKSLAAERGGTSPTGGSYSSGGDLKTGEGMPNYSSNPFLSVSETRPSTAPAGNMGSAAPTPPTKPSEYSGGSAQAATPSSSETPPVKPASLGGTGESPEGLNPQAGEGGGASPTGSEGTGLAKMVRGWVTGETE
jgi:LysM repeat protein